MDARALRFVCFAAASLAAFAAAAAEIVVYKQPQFTGEVLSIQADVGNLAPLGFHDQISSIVVKSGHWEACTQPRFHGECLVLGPGEYRTLDARINHRIESLREAPGHAMRRPQPRATPAAEAMRHAAIELFAAPGFLGGSLPVHDDAEALHESGGQVRAASLVVRDGRWQLCTDRGFEGICRVYTPGRYRDLGPLENRIGSARRIAPK